MLLSSSLQSLAKASLQEYINLLLSKTSRILMIYKETKVDDLNERKGTTTGYPWRLG